MSSKAYNIISTGSKGNAVILGGAVLIDAGVPFKALKPYLAPLKLVLLTHKHSDHFNSTTIRTAARERPTLRFGCGMWLINPLIVDCGVAHDRIDVLDCDHIYNYGAFSVAPVPLVHNVPNQGYKIHFSDWKALYATDTNSLNGVFAKDFDLYLIECNYEEEAIRARIAEKEITGEYAYERQVLKNHLSKAKCDDFIYRNASPASEYIYLHCHEDLNQDENE
jgi:phosphoribosyl 1,2-cyclic phosphodiesterase